MEILLIVLALIVIAGAALLGRRLGVATPLVLIAAGIAASFLPLLSDVEIEPEWILAGILPPLLYSAAVSMPAMDFRRDFGAIGGLSVVLVVLSSVVLGFFFAAIIPGLGLAWGIALGAIVSPTDAVATSIVKRVGVSPRVVAMLEGEGLLNDATALVVLRAAIAGAAASVSLWGVVGNFAFAVIVAVIIGMIVGRLDLAIRSRISDPTINTVLSFTVPFIASIPAALLGASGLVAAVAAGIVTGRGAARVLSPQHRASDAQNWRTVELILEGVIFLTMGLQLVPIVREVQADHAGFGVAAGIAAIALVLTILVRAAYVAPLIGILSRRAKRGEATVPRITAMQQKLDDPDVDIQEVFGRARPGVVKADADATARRQDAKASTEDRRAGGRPDGRPPRISRVEQLQVRLRRSLADIDYFLAQPLSWRDGTVIVWAGMRGAITLAAAQTLPLSAPSRSLLVLIAFLVAISSLLIQGSTLPAVVRLVGAGAAPNDSADADERDRLARLMRTTTESVPKTDFAAPTADDDPDSLAAKFTASVRYRLALIDAQRLALLDARDDGLFSTAALTRALDVLDADQISLELRGVASDEG